MKDCNTMLDTNTSAMIATYLQLQVVTTKGDVLGTRATIRLGLPQRSPLPPILFLIYIDYILQYCPRIESRAVGEQVRKDEITLTADAVIRQTRSWGNLQYWLKACGRGANKIVLR